MQLAPLLLIVAAMAAVMSPRQNRTVTAYALALALPKGSREREALFLALTVYGEARGEDEAGRRGVAHVILTRTRDRRWPSTVESVVLQKSQFEPWFPGTAARRLLESVQVTDHVFSECLSIAEAALDGRSEDPTGGADHFYATWMSRAPGWAARALSRLRIGQHVFLRVPW
jgi:spore germination cell wall hydrolase CwlJ-like protein